MRSGLLLAALFALCANCPAQPATDALANLRLQHPRLIALDADIARAKKLVAADDRAKRIYDRLVAEADALDNADTVKYELVGPRLLTQSRRALDRIYTLALMHRLTGERKYRDRAVKEMRAAANFPDWNPSHFLDTAEMTHALAIGYDWLYSALSEDERKWIREAIVEKGIKAAVPIYTAKRSWVRAHHNWNQVCNGGIGIGALAVAESEPELAKFILNSAAESLPLAMNSYAPDGGWNEGPGYWHYATRYNVYFLAALETAVGTDLGLSKLPGFDRAGHFRIYFSGPSNRTFNYADAGDGVGAAEEMYWLARRFGQPVYSWQQHAQIDRSKGAHALDLVWYQPQAKSPDEAAWPLNEVFKGVNVAFLRNRWTGPGAIFAAIKGGDNKANHSHLDLGAFVLDIGDTRFASDLGGDNYNLPQYFGTLRWTYYRLNSESHNTVLIDGESQNPKGEAPIVEFTPEPGKAKVVIDMTAAYPGKLKSWTRTMEMPGGKSVVLRDRIQANAPVEALWGMLTEAEVSVDGKHAMLNKNGRTLRAEIQSPASARFDIVPTQPPPPQRQNEGTRKLVVRLPGKVDAADIAVAFTPEL